MVTTETDPEAAAHNEEDLHQQGRGKMNHVFIIESTGTQLTAAARHAISRRRKTRTAGAHGGGDQRTFSIQTPPHHG